MTLREQLIAAMTNAGIENPERFIMPAPEVAAIDELRELMRRRLAANPKMGLWEYLSMATERLQAEMAKSPRVSVADWLTAHPGDGKR